MLLFSYIPESVVIIGIRAALIRGLVANILKVIIITLKYIFLTFNIAIYKKDKINNYFTNISSNKRYLKGGLSSYPNNSRRSFLTPLIVVSRGIIYS